MFKEYAIIVAGGSGSRMKSALPKQFLEINQKPVLMHTLSAFYNYSSQINIILVLPETQIPFWKELCKKHKFTITHSIVSGGNRRQDSVKNGLASIDDEGYVAIHDGVRPFINKKIISQSFKTAQEKGNAVVSIALKDSLRYVSGESNKAVDRSQYRIIQTPQTFSIAQIKDAYEKCMGEFTDDAAVLESAGNSIHLIEGSYDNIKITTAEDLIYAEAILRSAGSNS